MQTCGSIAVTIDVFGAYKTNKGTPVMGAQSETYSLRWLQCTSVQYNHPSVMVVPVYFVHTDAAFLGIFTIDNKHAITQSISVAVGLMH